MQEQGNAHGCQHLTEFLEKGFEINERTPSHQKLEKVLQNYVDLKQKQGIGDGLSVCVLNMQVA